MSVRKDDKPLTAFLHSSIQWISLYSNPPYLGVKRKLLMYYFLFHLVYMC